MIDLYTWSTPNGRKISIALEEMGLHYVVHKVDIGNDEQFLDAFLKVSPNNKIPAIFDQDVGVSVFESSAILTYLAEKSGLFLSAKQPQRAKVLEWLAWQSAGLGPTLGQLNYFINRSEEKSPLAISRSSAEAVRLFGVLNDQLAKSEYVAGDYSIADMAIYPWSILALDTIEQQADKNFENVARWHAAIGLRPKVQAGMAIPNV